MGRITDFFDERFDLSPIRRWVSDKTVPQHKHSFWYYFGGLALFLLTVQIITGILLAFYYSPNPANANESVRYIMEHVQYGWLIRSIHFWGANFLIAVVLVHMFSTFFMKAYRKPREVMWILGVLILALVLTFSFTGYLLPWTTLSYFATKVGVNTPMVMPVIGNFISQIMQGGEDVSAATLTRMFTLHTVILPLTAAGLVTFHVLLSQVLGTSVPLSIKKLDGETKFFPHFLMRDAAVWSGTFAILLAFASVFPANLDPKVNPILPAPAGIKPEWYFLFIFQTLRTIPEIAAVGLVTLGGIVWLMVPFLDRKPVNGKPFFTLFGIGVIVYTLTMTIFAYITTAQH
ncbi:MAG TPA: cytochrome bc complex cytochrome b subunit [Candidatus Acidoferrales bacterium]|nr:cytochrome bc complex cytochrome b subunit [Candidatus Acidoferrales bacterium]